MNQLHTTLSARVTAYTALLAAWWRCATTRRILQSLDPRQLADIGLTEAERDHECAKWFWQGSAGTWPPAGSRSTKVVIFARRNVALKRKSARGTRPLTSPHSLS
jgi:uncharacterized protein YjiS (DUF1127 family)